ncbi:Alpha/Beta hydrolase protein [Lactarius deliciosus]|nr:Alpha/Beta hydrolase protein [Lactarius deliciosus]
MSVEQPFKISVPKDALALFNCKLELHSTAGRGQRAEWAYDAPLTDIRRLHSRWGDGYDWRTHERDVSALPMLTRTIAVEGFSKLSVHYVHQWSAAKCAISLLSAHGFVHGAHCAGLESFLKVTKLLPALLTKGVLKKGFHAKHYAELFNKLMISLGYTCKVGDWGHVLTLTTASLYGHKHVKVSHTNTPILPSRRRSGSGRPARMDTQEARHVALDRCVLLTDDEVLGLDLLVLTRGVRSVRIYYELAQVGQVAKIVFESEHEVGGHFAAYEQPEALVGDLREMFGKSGPATAIVPGCTGYRLLIGQKELGGSITYSRMYTNRIILFLKWLALQSLSLLQKAKFYSRSRSTLLPTRLPSISPIEPAISSLESRKMARATELNISP